MNRFRVIPVLLYSSGGLVKTVRFKNPKYVGDPINAIKIFNDKEVDELILLDIDATKNKKGPNFKLVEEVANECFMPFSYGGGITSIEEIKKLLNLGAEKIVINSSATNENIIKEASSRFGSQSIVICIDIKKNWQGKYYCYTNRGEKNIKISPIDFAKKMESFGAGELILQFIDKDGTYSGYDLNMIEKISKEVTIPIVACGGASSIEDFTMAVKAGAFAVAAGSMFVFYGKLKSVLINYPTNEELKELFK